MQTQLSQAQSEVQQEKDNKLATEQQLEAQGAAHKKALQEAAQQMQVELPLVITGATVRINGTYKSTGELHNGMTLFQKEADPNKWLRYTTSNKWMISPTSAKDENSCVGLMYCVETGLTHPTAAATWKPMGKWEEQGIISVVSAHFQQVFTSVAN